MTNILENSLVMVVLAALIWIPVFLVKRNNKKKNASLLHSIMERIKIEHDFKPVHQDRAGNILIANSSSLKLLVLNLLDFSYDIIDMEKIKTVEEETSYNGKEVKQVKLLLNYTNGPSKEISFYKQYHDSERTLSAAKKLVAKWSALLSGPA